MYIYDSECYPNVYLIGIANYEKSKYICFEISERRDDRNELYDYLRDIYRDKSYMVGFNNLKYDFPLLSFILQNKQCSNKDIFKVSSKLISSEDFAKRPYIPQIDLMAVHHMDNKAKMTSLKVLEFNMRMDNIEELPFTPGTILNSDEIEKLKKYMKHDVKATSMFYEHSKNELEFRYKLNANFKNDIVNYNDVRIGKEVFVSALKKSGINIYNEDGSLNQTPRDEIIVENIILDYISFERQELIDVYNQFKNLVIVNTKGEFGISADLDGFILDYGLGGLHGSLNEKLIVSDEHHDIVNMDVSSFYPNLAIKNKFYPHHLTEAFCDVYENLYNERKKFPKGSAENAAYKLALNGTYGASNSLYSPFYDPQFTMSITINGELLLSMLIEKLLNINNLQLLQVNTDGLMVRIEKKLLKELDKVCEEWQTMTKLDLEFEKYSKIYLRDTNNYILLSEDGKIKRKGVYDHELQWHQNFSALVVPKAVEKWFIEGVDIDQAIVNHEDKYDFFLRTKVPRKSSLYWGNKKMQNVTRYYVSNEGDSLMKIMPPIPKVGYRYILDDDVQIVRTKVEIKKLERKGYKLMGEAIIEKERYIGINVGWKTKTCNDIKTFDNDINYHYYIEEAQKLIRGAYNED